MDLIKLRPFIPSGEDYPQAKRFFEDLGFQKMYSDSGLTIFQMGEQEFYLQNFHNEEFQNNYMVELLVSNLDEWWTNIQNNILSKNYPIKVKEPTEYPWGKREIHLIDPSGVCWHIAESK